MLPPISSAPCVEQYADPQRVPHAGFEVLVALPAVGLAVLLEEVQRAGVLAFFATTSSNIAPMVGFEPPAAGVIIISLALLLCHGFGCLQLSWAPSESDPCARGQPCGLQIQKPAGAVSLGN